MGSIVRFESLHLHLKPESRPAQVHLEFIPGSPVTDAPPVLEVEARDAAGHAVTRRPLKQMAHWLFINRYTWLPGSQAIWVRQ